MTVTLHLPFPPTVNAANRAGVSKSGKPFVYSSQEKRKFFRDADVLVLARRPTGFVLGPFTYHLIINENMRHGNADLDNRTKYCLDYAQKIGVIENDKLQQAYSVAWGPCEFGAMLTIWPYEPKVPVASSASSPNAAGQDEKGNIS